MENILSQNSCNYFPCTVRFGYLFESLRTKSTQCSLSNCQMIPISIFGQQSRPTTAQISIQPRDNAQPL